MVKMLQETSVIELQTRSSLFFSCTPQWRIACGHDGTRKPN